jgi:hypothetical protein
MLLSDFHRVEQVELYVARAWKGQAWFPGTGSDGAIRMLIPGPGPIGRWLALRLQQAGKEVTS